MRNIDFSDITFGILTTCIALAVLALVGLMIVIGYISIDDYKNNRYVDKSEITIVQEGVNK